MRMQCFDTLIAVNHFLLFFFIVFFTSCRQQSRANFGFKRQDLRLDRSLANLLSL